MFPRTQVFRPHALAIAVAAATSAFSASALADKLIDTLSTRQEFWTDENLTVTDTGSIIPAMNYEAIYAAGFGTLGTLTNHGTVDGKGLTALNNRGTIPLVLNTGTLTGNIAISNNSEITSLSNAGNLTGALYAVQNFGIIAQLTNSSTIASTSNDENARAIWNGTRSVIGTLTNEGTIQSAQHAIENRGLIETLSNTGKISGTASGIKSHVLGSKIHHLINAGTITGRYGLDISGAIGVLTNSGTIQGVAPPGQWSTGIQYAMPLNDSEPAPVINNAGLITGGNVALGMTYIQDPGTPGRTMGVLNNGGTIAGPIVTSAMVMNAQFNLGPVDDPMSHPFLINGGQDGTQGTITGSGGAVGEIYSYSSALIFGTGNLLLNSHIIAGLPPSPGSIGLPPAPPVVVINQGATLRVDKPIRVEGSYQQDASAGLQIGIADNAVATGELDMGSGYGRLVVSDAALVAAGASVTLHRTGASYAFAPGQRYVAIDASATGTEYHANTLNYSLDDTRYDISGAAIASADRSKLVLTINGKPGGVDPTDPGAPGEPNVPGIPQNPATQANAHSALEGLSRYTGVDDDGLLNLYNAGQAIRLGGANEANRAGDQLSPANASSLGRAANASTLQLFELVSSRHENLRMRQFGGTGVATGGAGPARAAWGQAFGGHARQNRRDDVSGYDADFGGLVLGLDHAIGRRWRAGGALSYSNTQMDFKDSLTGNTSRIDSYGLIGYASYTADAWYADLSAGVIAQRYRVRRNIGFPGFSGRTRGEFDGQQYLVRAETGYPIAFGSATVTPLAALNYNFLRQDGYAETGGNGAALSVGSASLSSITSDLGLKASRTFTTAQGLLTPTVQLAWRHEYRDGKVATHASFAGDPSGQTAFSILGAKPVRDAALASAGVTLNTSDTFSISARYDLQAGGGFLSQAGSLRLRQLF